VGCRAATVGGRRAGRAAAPPTTGRTAGPDPTLADRWRPKATRSAVQPVGAARHRLVLLGLLSGTGPRSAAEWSAPWKRSFCSYGPDKNRTTVLCVSALDSLRPRVYEELGAVASSLALPSCPYLSFEGRASDGSNDELLGLPLKKEGGRTSQKVVASPCRAAARFGHTAAL
jgi:hypothetical protein